MTPVRVEPQVPRTRPRRGRETKLLFFDELPVSAERVRQHRVGAQVGNEDITARSLAGHFGGVEDDHVRVGTRLLDSMGPEPLRCTKSVIWPKLPSFSRWNTATEPVP